MKIAFEINWGKVAIWLTVIVGICLATWMILDRDDYSMPTDFTVTSVDYYPAHSEEGMMYNAALKMSIPYTYYYAQYWNICGDDVVEGGPRHRCIGVDRDPGQAIIGQKWPSEYGFSRYSHHFAVRFRKT